VLNTYEGKHCIPNLINDRNPRTLYRPLLSITITDNYLNVKVQYGHIPDLHTRRQMSECLSHQDRASRLQCPETSILSWLPCTVIIKINVATLLTWQSL
jgi:hypothetical protein